MIAEIVKGNTAHTSYPTVSLKKPQLPDVVAVVEAVEGEGGVVVLAGM